MISTAARMFCWFSARWVTSMVEFRAVLNRLAAAASTTNPIAIETMASTKVKPRSVFCVPQSHVFHHVVHRLPQR